MTADLGYAILIVGQDSLPVEFIELYRIYNSFLSNRIGSGVYTIPSDKEIVDHFSETDNKLLFDIPDAGVYCVSGYFDHEFCFKRIDIIRSYKKYLAANQLVDLYF
jgi:hypothetical protein